jgi:hypothetical protein
MRKALVEKTSITRREPAALWRTRIQRNISSRFVEPRVVYQSVLQSTAAVQGIYRGSCLQHVADVATDFYTASKDCTFITCVFFPKQPYEAWYEVVADIHLAWTRHGILVMDGFLVIYVTNPFPTQLNCSGCMQVQLMSPG